jgi:hypothetical protein
LGAQLDKAIIRARKAEARAAAAEAERDCLQRRVDNLALRGTEAAKGIEGVIEADGAIADAFDAAERER